MLGVIKLTFRSLSTPIIVVLYFISRSNHCQDLQMFVLKLNKYAQFPSTCGSETQLQVGEKLSYFQATDTRALSAYIQCPNMALASLMIHTLINYVEYQSRSHLEKGTSPERLIWLNKARYGPILLCKAEIQYLFTYKAPVTPGHVSTTSATSRADYGPNQGKSWPAGQKYETWHS